MDHAVAGNHCAVLRAAALAQLAASATRSGPSWWAVRTGAESNDLNVVVSAPGFIPGPGLLEQLQHWWDGVPASWLVREADEGLTRVLVDAGWIPERTGGWCGRTLDRLPQPPHSTVHPVPVQVVDDGASLDQWLDIASECGWFDTVTDRAVRRELRRQAADDQRHSAWIAVLGDQPVGMASGWCDASFVEIVDVAVRPAARRHGVGAALVSSVLDWGAARGAHEVVAAPSPDGWLLFDALGFGFGPVIPDTCFYWAG